LCVKGPLLFHAMPESFRVDVVRRYLGPAPAWYTREQVEGLNRPGFAGGPNS